MRSLLVILHALLAFLTSGPVLQAKEKVELLAKHETLVVFEGSQFRLCRGRTARCPKQCGHSGEFANFRIVEYLKYEKPGKYGEGKQKSKLIQVSDFDKKPKGDPKLLAVVKNLKQGDRVLLNWRHDYVNRNGSSFPVRPITKLEKEQAD